VTEKLELFSNPRPTYAPKSVDYNPDSVSISANEFAVGGEGKLFILFPFAAQHDIFHLHVGMDGSD
jgi:hypothetical protein